MVKILREADHAPVTEVAKKHGVSDVTWRKRHGQLEAVDVKRLGNLSSRTSLASTASYVAGDRRYAARELRRCPRGSAEVRPPT